MFETSQLVGIFESAFAPLKCVAEIQDYDTKFGFGIHMPDGSLIEHREKSIDVLLKNEHYVISVIQAVRSRVESKGIKLSPWSLPRSSGPQ